MASGPRSKRAWDKGSQQLAASVPGQHQGTAKSPPPERRGSRGLVERKLSRDMERRQGQSKSMRGCTQHSIICASSPGVQSPPWPQLGHWVQWPSMLTNTLPLTIGQADQCRTSSAQSTVRALARHNTRRSSLGEDIRQIGICRHPRMPEFPPNAWQRVATAVPGQREGGVCAGEAGMTHTKEQQHSVSALHAAACDQHMPAHPQSHCPRLTYSHKLTHSTRPHPALRRTGPPAEVSQHSQHCCRLLPASLPAGGTVSA